MRRTPFLRQSALSSAAMADAAAAQPNDTTSGEGFLGATSNAMADAADAAAAAALVALPQPAAAAAGETALHTMMSIDVNAEPMLTECVCGLCITVCRCLSSPRFPCT